MKNMFAPFPSAPGHDPLVGVDSFAPEFWRLIQNGSPMPLLQSDRASKDPQAVGDEIKRSPRDLRLKEMWDSMRISPVWRDMSPPLIQEPEPGHSYGMPVPHRELPSPGQIAVVRGELERNRAKLSRMERGAEKFKQQYPGEAKELEKDMATLRDTIDRAEQALWQVERGT